MGKRFLSFLFIFFSIISFCLTGCASAKDTSEVNNSPENCAMVYYFHGNFRCSNCYRIEQYTKEAIEQYFNNELSSGKLIFKPVNTDKKQNQHFLTDYQLYTRSVVVSLVKDGKEIKYENLVGVWDYLRDETQFFNYIRDEVNKYLKELE
ncbi:MAG: hypothetical protein KJ967_02095 [Elusimicrobia bacterium]|nr:hypothetical protein [Elusimicrobiota bacterium]